MRKGEIMPALRAINEGYERAKAKDPKFAAYCARHEMYQGKSREEIVRRIAESKQRRNKQ